MLRTYGKSVAALIVAILTVVASALTDGRITSGEAVQIAIAAATACAVYVAPNMPRYPWVKTVLAAILAALNLAVSLITDGMSSADTVNLIIAGIGVFAVGAAPAMIQRQAAAAPANE